MILGTVRELWRYPVKSMGGEQLRCRARIVSPTGDVCIALPDGRQLTSEQDDIDAALSALSGRTVKLVDTSPAYPEIDRYWPDVEGLALRDMVTTNKLGQGAPFGTFFDYAPLHLLTTATLSTLSRVYPSGQIDVGFTARGNRAARCVALWRMTGWAVPSRLAMTYACV